MNKIRIEFEETGLDKSFIDIIRDQILSKIKDTQCPCGHKEYPIITISGKDAKGLNLSIKGCCNTCKEIISSKLNS
jgi:hypothetical protein